MQNFIFKPNENGTSAVVGYEGNEANVRIPDSYGGGVISVIGDKLFSGHAEIELVSIPDTVTDMGEFIFDGCDNLSHIALPSQLECLWGYTFVRCGVEEIVLPDKLVTLPPFAFKDCKELRKIHFGKGLEKVYGMAFQGCDKLERPVFGDNVEVSPKAFE